MLLLSLACNAVVVRVETVIGSFDITTREDVAPATVANFLNYVRDRDYDNMFFHRSIPNFVVQGGGFGFMNGTFQEVPSDPPVINEFNLSNIRGTVAMAKVGGDPNSATNEWFVNLNDNSANLDFQNGGFTVFGTVDSNEMAIPDTIGFVENAIPGVTVTSVDGFVVPPMSVSPFATVFRELPALNYVAGTTFDPLSNLVLVTKVREVGADLFPSQSALAFGVQDVGTGSEQAITITNKGLEDLVLQISPLNTGGGSFSVSGNTCTGPLVTDAVCTLTFQYLPQGNGLVSGSFQITSNDTDKSQLTIQLSGEGVAVPEPRISLSPSDTLPISDIEVGQSGSDDVVATNVGTAELVISSIGLSGTNAGEFSQVNNCTSLTAKESCTITVTFTPTAGAGVTADLTITSNDPTQPAAVLNVTGSGQAPDATLEAPPDFGSVAVNAFKLAETALNLQNIGNADLELISIEFGGKDSGEFVFLHDCASTIAAGDSCPITVYFRPTSAGEKNATLVANTNDPDHPSISVPLTGIGAGLVDPAPHILANRPAVEFAQQVIDVPAERVLKLNNYLGTAALNVESITLGGFNAADYSQTNDCSVLEPLTGSCTITVTLLASTIGLKAGTLIINSNDPDQPELRRNMGANVLAPEAADILLVAAADFGEVTTGRTATKQLRLSSQGKQDLQISSITLSGADANMFTIADNCPAILAPNNGCDITVTFTPAERGLKTAIITVVSNDPDEGTFVTSLSGTGTNDADGVSDEIEDGHPNKNADGRGDGNGDGVADALQANVTSLPNIYGEYVTLVSSGDTQLVGVEAGENPLPSGTPVGIGTEVRFEQGFFSFVLADVTGPVTVTYIFSPGTTISNFFQIGSTSDKPDFHWYQFEYDGRLGAEINGNEVVLHLEDGQRGDSDLAINGLIYDPGAPALVVPLPLSSKSGGGCSITAGGVNWRGRGDWWLIIAMIGWVGFYRRRHGIFR